MLPGQPTTPQPHVDATGSDVRMPRKRQARLDDNGEPAGVPASKKMKSAEQNGQKKKPTKTRPEKNRNSSKIAIAPSQKKASVETGVANNSEDSRNRTNPQEPSEPVTIESSDDEADVIEMPEAPEEDDEAELGVYLLSSKVVSC